MKMLTGKIGSQNYALTIEPAAERSTRDTDGVVHETRFHKAVMIVAENGDVTNVFEREFETLCASNPELLNCEAKFIRADMREIAETIT